MSGRSVCGLPKWGVSWCYSGINNVPEVSVMSLSPFHARLGSSGVGREQRSDRREGFLPVSGPCIGRGPRPSVGRLCPKYR